MITYHLRWPGRRTLVSLCCGLLAMLLPLSTVLAQSCPLYPSPHLRMGFNVAPDGGIDINNYDRARDIIKSHLANNEYQDRLPYIIEARRIVLEKENLFAILNDKINAQEKKITGKTMGKVIYNRQSLRIRKPLAGIRSLVEKALTKAYHRFAGTSNNKSMDS